MMLSSSSAAVVRTPVGGRSAARGRVSARAVAVMRAPVGGRGLALGGARVAYGGSSAGALRVEARGVTLGASRKRGLVVKAMFEVRRGVNRARDG